MADRGCGAGLRVGSVLGRSVPVPTRNIVPFAVVLGIAFPVVAMSMLTRGSRWQVVGVRPVPGLVTAASTACSAVAAVGYRGLRIAGEGIGVNGIAGVFD